jgi:alanine dehydrogenase
MQIGVPKEIKAAEHRVSMVPAGARHLVEAGHSVHVQTGAGAVAGFADQHYRGDAT